MNWAAWLSGTLAVWDSTVLLPRWNMAQRRIASVEKWRVDRTCHGSVVGAVLIAPSLGLRCRGVKRPLDHPGVSGIGRHGRQLHYAASVTLAAASVSPPAGIAGEGDRQGRLGNQWVPQNQASPLLHAAPVKVYGSCKGGVDHQWAMVGAHLACGRCGWVACCGVRLHMFPARSPRPCSGYSDHEWVPTGVHWRCGRCCLVPCCATNFRRSRPKRERRAQLLAAASAETGGRCFWCGVRFGDPRLGKGAEATLDHRIPRMEGGRHSADNLVAACDWCNQARMAMSVTDWETSKRLQRRRLEVFGFALDAMGVLRGGGYKHPASFETVPAGRRCPLCGTEGTTDEIRAMPCVTFFASLGPEPPQSEG